MKCKQTGTGLSKQEDMLLTLAYPNERDALLSQIGEDSDSFKFALGLQKLVRDRADLLKQIETLDSDALLEVKACVENFLSRKKGEPEAPVVKVLTEEERRQAVARGEKVLRAKKVAALVVAGGQGSRLGYDGPKGAYPIGPRNGKSIFYFHARKIVALQKRYGVSIPFYIMTSAENHSQTIAHFEKNDFFELDKTDVIFFKQGMWPTLTKDGKIIVDKPGHIFMNPDGHGGTIAALDKHGLFTDMATRGVEVIFYFQVDNPLVEIADPAFIGLHVSEGAYVSTKVCAKRDPKENVGVVAMRKGHTEIVEYSELTDEQKKRKGPDGELYFKYGSVGIHVFSRKFLEAQANRTLPLHVAQKKIPMRDDTGNVVKRDGYKFEKLIFDVLPNAKEKVVNLAFDRADEFSPVKNPVKDENGNFCDDSPATCQRDMQAKWRRQLQLPDDGTPIEIDPVHRLNALPVRA